MFQGVGVNRIAKVGDVGGVFSFSGGGGEAKLYGTVEIFENFTPGGIVFGAATVALVDNDQIKKITRDGFEDFVFFIGAGECLVQAEINLVGRVYFAVFDFGHDRAKGLEVIHQGLVGKDVAVYQK